MEFRNFDIAGPLEILPRKIEDDRGYFTEIFRHDWFLQHAPEVQFVQDNQSLSVRAGRLFDVAVDLRADSPTFGRWISVVLSPEACNQLWVPVGFGHAFCTLEPNSIVSYRVTSYYSPEHDQGVAWDDPDIAVEWPDIADPTTLSDKDRRQPKLAALPVCFSMKDK
jgi:dTDP-4-dehydrorhamnose 3,5-epimerase